MTDGNLSVGIDVDTGELNDVLSDLEARSRSFGAALTGALKSAASDGKGLEDVLRGLALRVSEISLSAGLKPLENLLTSSVSSVASSLPSLLGFANGGVPGRVQPFAAGGVVSSPTFFPMGGDVGLMGEAGTEAVMPLKRGADGKLGVAMNSAGGGSQIVFNVQATDAASFRKSEAQISAMLARAVGRGQRGV
ncbi:phage tail tape measure protein [Rhizobium sp. L1K21]|uniref:phage tail tape measure protein n=1 Tax=Rhizobium sp. L1K21 TaxID=2954933 RepID=UPI0020930B60|nr:phage tail tape measure protein [Rhizobium sp. L1K21]MCO6186685.1 phage tail tape measure protein [Rhizobium sp. L1K21]